MSQTTLATGVFDVLHAEHIEFLKRAKALGGRLIVGIESDVRVRRLKGEGRPVNGEDVRRKNIERLGIVDEVFVLPEKFDLPEEHLDLLKKIKPDILAVSSHTPHIAEKIRLMKDLGGRVEVVHQHNPNISSTLLIKKQRTSG